MLRLCERQSTFLVEGSPLPPMQEQQQQFFWLVLLKCFGGDGHEIALATKMHGAAIL